MSLPTNTKIINTYEYYDRPLLYSCKDVLEIANQHFKTQSQKALWFRSLVNN